MREKQKRLKFSNQGGGGVQGPRPNIQRAHGGPEGAKRYSAEELSDCRLRTGGASLGCREWILGGGVYRDHCATGEAFTAVCDIYSACNVTVRFDRRYFGVQQ